MKFFRNKLNIVLTLVLLILIGIGVVLGIKFFSKPAIKVIDFTNMYEDEVVAWSIENEVQDSFEYKHEYDEQVEAGKVIYQSLKEGETIEENVLIIVSDGPDKTNYIQIPVDTLKTQESFDAWALDKGLNNIKYEYIDDSDLDEGSIISIDPSELKAEDLVTVKVSSKKNIDVPDFSYMSSDEIEKWAKENDVKVVYNYEASDVKKDGFVKQSVKAGNRVSAKDTITIVLSSGKAKDTGKAYIDETKYLGMKEEDFLKELKELGFKNVVKIDEVYSSKRKEGTICYYLPDGNVNLETKIEYKVSKGDKDSAKTAYIDETKYLGMKEDEFLKELKDLGFSNIVKIAETTSTKYKEGTICYYLPDGKQELDTKIEYKIVKQAASDKTAYIDENKYLGVKEETFLKELKDLGFSNVTKIGEVDSKYPAGTICYYLPDGKQKLDTKIEYKISKASSTSKTAYIDEYKYLGVNETDFLKELMGMGFTDLTKIDSIYSDKYKEGTICYYLPDGNQKLDTTISYKVSLGKKPADPKPEEKPEPEKEPVKEGNILSLAIYQDTKSGSSYDETKNNMTAALVTTGGFSKVTFKGVASEKALGQIISISVNGNTSYKAGSYPVDTPIVIEICNKDTSND